MHRIVLLDAATLPFPVPRPSFPHEWVEYDLSPPDEVPRRLEGATIVISNKAPVRAEALEAASSLKLVAVAATGVDHVDVAACASRGIAVTNCRDYGGQAVAEHALALLFAVRRNLVAHDRAVRQGGWTRSQVFFHQVAPIHDLEATTLGIIGAGSIGRALARLAGAVGMEVLLAERRGEPTREGRVPFEEVLARADAVSLHLPLTRDTRRLFDTKTLALMKPGAVLVNTARGALVDPAALADALRSGHLSGAGLDVLEKEPPPEDDPLLVLHRERTANLLITAHVAWASERCASALAAQVTEAMEAFMKGESLRRVV